MKNEWVEAIKAGKPEIAYSNFDIASLLTEAFLLGNVAIRTGKTLEWDGPGLRVTNVPEANQLHPDRVPPRLGSHPELSRAELTRKRIRHTKARREIQTNPGGPFCVLRFVV